MKKRLQNLTPAQRAGYKRSVNAMKKRYEKFLKEQEEKEKKREEEAELAIDNIKATIAMAVDECSTPFTRDGAYASANIILSIIDESVDTWGYIFTAEKIEKWASDFIKKIARLVLAVIDTKGAGRYNTNTHAFKRDEKGDVGRQRYKDDMEKLARKLKVRSRLLDTIS